MVQDIRELQTPPTIGKYYMVPVVWCRLYGVEMPVWGDHHEDKAILKFDMWHYHFDHRFVSRRIMDRITKGGITTLALFGDVVHTSDLETYQITPIVRRLKCRRDMFVFPHVQRTHKFINKLETSFDAAKLQGGVCPHKGFNLNQCPVRDGHVVCPLHGLQWNKATGELAPRTTKATWEQETEI